jgi:hypothetical protein
MPVSVRKAPESSYVKITAIPDDSDLDEGDEGIVVRTEEGGYALLTEYQEEPIPVPAFTSVEVLSGERRNFAGLMSRVRESLSNRDFVRPQTRTPVERNRYVAQRFADTVDPEEDDFEPEETTREIDIRPEHSAPVERGPTRWVTKSIERARSTPQGIGGSGVVPEYAPIPELLGEGIRGAKRAIGRARQFSGQISGSVRSIGNVPAGSEIVAMENDPNAGIYAGDTGIARRGPRGRTRVFYFADTGETVEPRQGLQVRIIEHEAPEPEGRGHIPTFGGTYRQPATSSRLYRDIDDDSYIQVRDRRYKSGYRIERRHPHLSRQEPEVWEELEDEIEEDCPPENDHRRERDRDRYIRESSSLFPDIHFEEL